MGRWPGGLTGRTRTPATRPDLRTLLLSLGLAALALALVALDAGSEPLVDAGAGLGGLRLLLALAAAFLLAESCVVFFEVRRQAFTLTLTGVPLVLALLLLDVPGAVTARLLGALVGLVVQRLPPAKIAYNLSACAWETAVAASLLHLVVPAPVGSVTTTAALAVLVLVAATDQASLLLVRQVVRWHQGTGVQDGPLQLAVLLTSVLTWVVALAALVLLGEGAVGALVLGVASATAAVVYRSYQVLHRRHEALASVHAFVGVGHADATVAEMTGVLLEQVRAVMRARRAELLLVDTDGEGVQRVVEEGLEHEVGIAPWALGDTLVQGVRSSGTPALLARSGRADAERRWLEARGVADAVVVPLPASTCAGALVVSDRLGDTGSFTPEDVKLLATLAGHLAVAVRGTRLLERLRHEAGHDLLTGLANRALLKSEMEARSEGPDALRTAVLLLDLDRFKEVNDTLGHHVGDDLLRVVADVVQAALPSSAVVARLGGDEFAAVVPLEATGTQAEVEAEAEALGHDVARALAAPVTLPEATLSARASVGVAVAEDGATPSDLLRRADTAMYAAKERGVAVVRHTPELDRGRAERLAMLADLRLALDRDELYLLYQPKVDLRTGRVCGAEALVRWDHPVLGLVGPDVFVPLAEADGLVDRLTDVVLREALGQATAWARAGLDLSVAVNLSARSVSDERLPVLLSEHLARAGLPPSRLVLEITESSVMQHPERSVAVLDRIVATGVRIALDDFGTGYSSLSYLQRLPVSEVKVDRSFVRRLSAAPRSQVLVSSIVGLAVNLGLVVVAEGAEDDATVELLARLGCHLVQGYAVSPPVSAARVAALCAERLIVPGAATRSGPSAMVRLPPGPLATGTGPAPR